VRAEVIESGQVSVAGPVDFLKGVVAIDGLPPDDRLEVCFAGRSNVGKSSLINALTGRKALARTSSTPGRTQEINYFTLGEERFLVDLPGYGFAKAPKPVVEKWQRNPSGFAEISRRFSGTFADLLGEEHRDRAVARRYRNPRVRPTLSLSPMRARYTPTNQTRAF